MDNQEIIDLAQIGVSAVYNEENEFDLERAEDLATVLGTWCFSTTERLVEEGSDAEEAQIQALTNALMAAYFAGVLDSNNPTNPQGITIPGKSGTIVNLYIS